MNIVSVKFKIDDDENTFSYRDDSVGDKGVLNQIFLNDDYGISHWVQGKRLIEYHQSHSKNQKMLIIDAGANIGASALYFAKKYSNSIIYAIEPDKMNWHLLSINTASLDCINFHGAIASRDGELVISDPGRSDWGFMTSRIGDNKFENAQVVPSISPESILLNPLLSNVKPLIFKIDIEGAEDDLFEGECLWLNDFPLLVIELHDWMLPFSGSSRNFLRAIAKYEFDILHKGENIFIFNRNILG